MRHIETMKGSGTVTSNSGKQEAVQYEVSVYEKEISTGHLQGSGTIPGLKRYEGSVLPVCFFGENGLVLEMEDGRKMKSFFTDDRGSIALNQWIG